MQQPHEINTSQNSNWNKVKFKEERNSKELKGDRGIVKKARKNKKTASTYSSLVSSLSEKKI